MDFNWRGCEYGLTSLLGISANNLGSERRDCAVTHERGQGGEALAHQLSKGLDASFELTTDLGGRSLFFKLRGIDTLTKEEDEVDASADNC